MGAGRDDTVRVSPVDVPFARPAVRWPFAWDAAAAVLAIVGAALLLSTREPVWGGVVVLAAALTALGSGPRWLVGVPLLLGVTGWAVAYGTALARPGPMAGSRTTAWLVPSVGAVAVAVVAVAVRTRLGHERREVDRAVTFAQDIAVHDSLTGLTNRRGLALLGGQILESARRRGDAVYCIFVDVDGLSRVNDELGHAAGDDVLLTVAEGLRRSTRATDAVARWGNDQFVVVGPGTGLAPLEMERRIRAHCVEHTSIDRRIWAARVSAGGAVLEPWDDGTVDTMLRLADREMHLRRALRREAGAPAYRPTRLEQSPQRPHPRHPGGWQG